MFLTLFAFFVFLLHSQLSENLPRFKVTGRLEPGRLHRATTDEVGTVDCFCFLVELQLTFFNYSVIVPPQLYKIVVTTCLLVNQ